MANPTAGPWKVTPWHDGYHIELDGEREGNPWPTIGIVREEADAELIAAAPRLRDAVRLLLGCQHAKLPGDTCSCRSAAVKALRSAGVEAW